MKGGYSGDGIMRKVDCLMYEVLYFPGFESLNHQNADFK